MIAAVALAGAACGGGSNSNSNPNPNPSPTSPATVSGNINGQAFGAQDAVSNVLTAGPNSVALILVTNVASACAKVSASQVPRNGKVILILAGALSAASVSAPAAPGSYRVFTAAVINSQTGNVAQAVYQSVDGTCFPNGDLEATGGTVTFTRIDTSGQAGTFDLTFSDGSHATGTFTANKCTALTTNLTGTCT